MKLWQFKSLSWQFLQCQKNVMRRARVAGQTLFFCLLMAQQVLADSKPWQSTDSIVAAADGYMKSVLSGFSGRIEYRLGHIDPRLRLIRCDQALTAEPRSSRRLIGKGTITVRCDGAKPWSVYVPVQVKAWQDVLAAASPLSRGHAIQEDDLTMAQVQLSYSRQAYYVHSKDLLGKILQRPLAAGKPFHANMLKPALLIKRGQEVVLIAHTTAIKVRMKGKALADGAKGDLIKVRNNSSQRIVEGVVLDNGVVKVKM